MFPRGFYVVAIVEHNNDACVPERAEDHDWLWEAAVVSVGPTADDATLPTTKHMVLTVRVRLFLKLSFFFYF